MSQVSYVLQYDANANANYWLSLMYMYARAVRLGHAPEEMSKDSCDLASDVLLVSLHWRQRQVDSCLRSFPAKHVTDKQQG